LVSAEAIITDQYIVQLFRPKEYYSLQVYLLTPMDRATLLHVKSTILHYSPSIITRQQASV